MKRDDGASDLTASDQHTAVVVLNSIPIRADTHELYLSERIHMNFTLGFE